MIDLLGDNFLQEHSQEEGEPDKTATFADLEGKKVALFFSAGWCPPCKEFLPKLVEFYEEANKEEKKLEIVYVSVDKTEEQYKEHFAEMPWLAIPFSETERIERLEDFAEAENIPKVVFLNDSGEGIEKAHENARGLIQKGEAKDLLP